MGLCVVRQEWRYAFASVEGSSHVKRNVPCQDSSACRLLHSPAGELVLVCVASDGAGSAEQAAIGSRLTVSTFIRFFEEFLRECLVEEIDRDVGLACLSSIRSSIEAEASGHGLSVRDYSATLVGCVVGEGCSAFLQVGDGAVLVREDEQLNWVFWPEQGEYANTTFFVTDATAQQSLRTASRAARVDDVALFTDGLQSLVLHYASQTVHQPFFGALFPHLRCRADRGYQASTSQNLAAYLSSPAVRSRSDDDITLVLASRADPPLLLLASAGAGREGTALVAVGWDVATGCGCSCDVATTAGEDGIRW